MRVEGFCHRAWGGREAGRERCCQLCAVLVLVEWDTREETYASRTNHPHFHQVSPSTLSTLSRYSDPAAAVLVSGYTVVLPPNRLSAAVQPHEGRAGSRLMVGRWNRGGRMMKGGSGGELFSVKTRVYQLRCNSCLRG